MKYTKPIRLLLSAIIIAAGLSLYAKSKNEPRALYTYGFGGIENLEVEDAVAMLENLGYAGIAVDAKNEAQRERLDQYNDWSERKGDEFQVVAAFISHRFDRSGFSDEAHRAAIDRLEGKDGTLWVWGRDGKPNGSVTDEKVEAFFTGIFEYAHSKGVKVILYPHYSTYYPTVEDALPLVEKVDHPSFNVAINLCHELMSDKGDSLVKSFERAKGRIGAIILSGALIELDRTNVMTMNKSTILPLDESIYNLKPYVQLIKESDFKGPIGFINFQLDNPSDYLERSITRWKELCHEVGLYN